MKGTRIHPDEVHKTHKVQWSGMYAYWGNGHDQICIKCNAKDYPRGNDSLEKPCRGFRLPDYIKYEWKNEFAVHRSYSLRSRFGYEEVVSLVHE